MKISTKGRYAVRLMADLAEHDAGEYISLKEISDRQGISVKYLEQIVRQLCAAGYLKSVRGSAGGYRLIRRPEEYTLLQIVETIEGSLAPVACLEDEANQCQRYGGCSTVRVWEGLYRQIKEYLGGITLRDLVKKPKKNGDLGNIYIEALENADNTDKSTHPEERP